MEPTVLTEPTAVAAATAAPAPKTLLRNSLWCTDDRGRLGMIGEMTGQEVMFFYAGPDGKLAPECTYVDQAKLKVAKAAELPGHLGYTAQQCAEIGYE